MYLGTFRLSVPIWMPKISAQIKEKLMQKHQLSDQMFDTIVFGLCLSAQTIHNEDILYTLSLHVSPSLSVAYM